MTQEVRFFFTHLFRGQKYFLWRLVGAITALVAVSLTLAPAAKARSFQVALNWSHWIGYIIWLLCFLALTYSFRQSFESSKTAGLARILLPVGLLTGWGILTIWRLDPGLGLRQSVWFLAGTIGFLYGIRYQEFLQDAIQRYKYLWLAAGLGLTALTLIFGINPNKIGPNLWLGCCGIYLQPSEPLKVLLILYLAAYFSETRAETRSLLQYLLPTILTIATACLILIIQRDLGTAFIMIFIYSAMIYSATGKKRLLLISGVGILLAAVLGFFLFDVVQLRAEAWINPWQDPSDRSYQIVQSLIAVAAGGLTGRGPGMGYPGLVPISFSDFIFTAIAEEYGLPGSLALILVLTLLVISILKLALLARSRHGYLLAVGIATFLGGQAILIIGGNIRLLPLTGVTLPFVSYGGSSLLTSLFAVLLLVLVSSQESSTSVREIIPRDPARHLAGLILAGFALLATVNGWWSIYRGPDLLTRTDNLRRSINDQFIQRGDILDRKGVPLAITTGQPGDFYRRYLFVETAQTIGYTQPFFGQAGVESTLDPILRGLENNSSWNIWRDHLLYGQSPEGLGARLTLDIDLQQTASRMMPSSSGAVVLLNARSGEILVMYSAPAYDSNQIIETWDQISQDLSAPLLNRAAQGLYPPGPALGPLLLPETGKFGPLPEEITSLDVTVDEQILRCAHIVNTPATWARSIAAGCPAPLRLLGIELDDAGLTDLFTRLGFFEGPEIRLPVSVSEATSGFATPSVTAFGQADILVSPLQLALAAATLSNHGIRPTPEFLHSALNYQNEWVSYLDADRGIRVFVQDAADQAAYQLAHPTLSIWETLAFAYTDAGDQITWYLGGTLPPSAPTDPAYTVVVILEKPHPDLAAAIGRRLLTSLQQPDPDQ